MTIQKELSYLDPGGVLKNSHSESGNALRVIDVDNIVGSYYNRVELTTDANDSVTNSKFYLDTEQQITQITTSGDSSGSLSGKYFLLNSANNESEFYVWYDVDNSSIDPAVSGRTGIRIPISTNDLSFATALGTAIVINTNHSDDFFAKAFNNTVIIENKELGETDQTLDFNTGFTFVQKQAGETELLKDYDIPQQNDVRYVYNHAEKTFEVFSTSPIEVTLESSSSSAFIENITTVAANTEYNFVLPDETKRFAIRLRETDSPLKVKYQSGGNHILLPRGTSYSEENLVTDNVTLYFETELSNRTVEIIYWT